MEIRIAIQATAFRRDKTTDDALLASIHDVSGEELFSEYIVDHDDSRINKFNGIREGKLKFAYDASSKTLWSVVNYTVDRRLDSGEMGALFAYTLGQLSDGIGENFSQDYVAKTGIFIVPVIEPMKVRIEYLQCLE